MGDSDTPRDPETAALDMITRLLAQADYGLLAAAGVAAVLREDRCFRCMAWPDARRVAIEICADITLRDDPAGHLRNRARDALSGADGIAWRDRAGVARAFNIAAAALS